MCPSAARSAALVRETPKRRATPASSRSPSSPSGTRTVRTSGTVTALIGGRAGALSLGVVLGSALGLGLGSAHVAVTAAVDPDAQQGEEHDEHGRTDDPDVGDVADEPPVVVEEV